jgi:deaminated glutathione amidase
MTIPAANTVMAAVQMTSGDDLRANLTTARMQLELAAARGSRLVVLPENFAFMAADDAARSRIAEADGRGPIQDYLARAARELRIWIVGGTLPIASPDRERPFAACCVWNDMGERVARYDKIHLFDVQVPGSVEAYRESRRTTPGDSPLTLATPFGEMGVAVCYDLRFPELFRVLMARAVSFMALPAAFTVRTGQAHWHTLLRARAIENLCYVIAAAQSGEHPGGRRTYGHSLVVGPWGEILAEAPPGPGVVTAALDAAYLERLRSQFPALGHRRLASGAA